MSAESSNVPAVKERNDVILMHDDIECTCGRLKNKAHCPSCGSVRLYGMASTVIGLTPDNTVVKECKTYRCIACGEKFNDVDWYFKCHAPKKIDWAATKKKAVDDRMKEAMAKWITRVKNEGKFDYNDRMKCKAETGLFPEEIRDMNRALMTRIKSSKYTDEQRQVIEHAADEAQKKAAGIVINEVVHSKKLTPLQKHVDNCDYCSSHMDFCEEGKRIKIAEGLPQP